MSEPPKRYQGNRDYFILEGRTVKAVPAVVVLTDRDRCHDCCLSWYTNPNPRVFSLDCYTLLLQGLRPECSSFGPVMPAIYFVVTEESLL